MNELTDREKWDIKKISEGELYYSTLSERHKTAAVSLAAVSKYAGNLEYVPDSVISRDICRAAIEAKDADCTIIPQIPYFDVQKEAAKKFSEKEPAFVVYSFIDTWDKEMAEDAVKKDAYCIQLVPNNLLDKNFNPDVQSQNVEKKESIFLTDGFPELKTEKTNKDEKSLPQKSVKVKF